MPGRAFFVGNVEVIPSAEDTWARLQDPMFSVVDTAILHEDETITTAAIDSMSLVSAELQSHSPKEIRWNVNTDADRLLVISEIYYPAGWKAYLDGEEVPVHRVKGAV